MVQTGLPTRVRDKHATLPAPRPCFTFCPGSSRAFSSHSPPKQSAYPLYTPCMPLVYPLYCPRLPPALRSYEGGLSRPLAWLQERSKSSPIQIGLENCFGPASLYGAPLTSIPVRKEVKHLNFCCNLSRSFT